MRSSRKFLPITMIAVLALIQATSAGSQIQWDEEILQQPPGGYASSKARIAAHSVIRYQSPEGGWLKNTNLLAPPASPTDAGRPTIDNGATTTPMRSLALVADATGGDKYTAASLAAAALFAVSPWGSPLAN